MGRLIGLALVALFGWVAVSVPAEAKLKRDIAPTAEAAMAVARAALNGYEGKEGAEHFSSFYTSAELKGGTWSVLFSPWDPVARALEPEPIPSVPGEVIIRMHCGFCARVDLSKKNGKVISISFER